MVASRPELDCIRHWGLTLPPGRMIYDESDPPRTFYRVETGCVRLQSIRDDGRRQILAFCLGGDFFGFEPGQSRIAAAETTVATELTAFPLGAALGAAADPRCGPAMVGAACDMISSLASHLLTFGYGSVDDRLTGFLDWLADRQGAARTGSSVWLPMSRRDIADFLGVASETLSRTFGRLEARGLIRVRSRNHIILRPRTSTRADPVRSAAA